MFSVIPKDFIIPSGGQIQRPASGSAAETFYTCKRSSECFLVNCKSTSSIVECVNTTEQNFYYKKCKDWSDVNIVQNIARCSCVNGICK